MTVYFAESFSPSETPRHLEIYIHGDNQLEVLLNIIMSTLNQVYVWREVSVADKWISEHFQKTFICSFCL